MVWGGLYTLLCAQLAVIVPVRVPSGGGVAQWPYASVGIGNSAWTEEWSEHAVDAAGDTCRYLVSAQYAS